MKFNRVKIRGSDFVVCNSPNYVPATSCALTAWWSGPTVNGPLDQRFQGNFPISPELLLAIQYVVILDIIIPVPHCETVGTLGSSTM